MNQYLKNQSVFATAGPDRWTCDSVVLHFVFFAYWTPSNTSRIRGDGESWGWNGKLGMCMSGLFCILFTYCFILIHKTMMENNLCNYIFDELVVMYDTEMLTTNKAGDDLIFTPEQMLVVELRGLKADSRFLSEEKVKLELFCADSDEPIYVSEGEPYDREVEMAIERSKLLQAGKYYVKIHNAVPHEKIQSRFDEWKEAYRYTFYLLEKGEQLEHPELKKAMLSPNLKLTMEWGHALTELDRFDVVVYNDDWELMGKAEHLNFRSSCVKTFLKSPFLWTDGAYFMVVSTMVNLSCV